MTETPELMQVGNVRAVRYYTNMYAPPKRSNKLKNNISIMSVVNHKDFHLYNYCLQYLPKLKLPLATALQSTQTKENGQFSALYILQRIWMHARTYF